MTTAHQVIHALKWNAVGRLSAQVISWTVTLVVMRLLTPGDYGLMSLAVTVIGFLTLFNRLGAIPALIQKREIDDILVRKVYGLLLLCNFALYAIIFIGAPYFAEFFDQSQLTELLQVLGALLLLDASTAVPNALLQRELRFKTISLTELVSAAVGSSAILLLALFGFGVWSLVAGSLLRQVLNTIILLKLTHLRVLPKFDFSGLKDILAFGMTVSSAQIVWYISGHFDVFLIGKILGKEALGTYSVVYNLALLPTNKMMSLSSQVAFAAYSRIQDERVRVARFFKESVSLSVMILFPACWGLSVIADDFVSVVLGPKWQQGAVVMQIISLGIPYRAVTLIVEPLLNGIGKPGVALKNILTTFFIMAVAMTTGVQFGLIGLCIGWVVGVVVATTINLNRSLPLLGITYTDIMVIVLPPIVGAGIMYVAVWATLSGPLAGFSPVARLPIGTAFGAILYGSFILIFNRSAVIHSYKIIRQAI